MGTESEKKPERFAHYLELLMVYKDTATDAGGIYTSRVCLVDIPTGGYFEALGKMAEVILKTKSDLERDFIGG